MYHATGNLHTEFTSPFGRMLNKCLDGFYGCHTLNTSVSHFPGVPRADGELEDESNHTHSNVQPFFVATMTHFRKFTIV